MSNKPRHFKVWTFKADQRQMETVAFRRKSSGLSLGQIVFTLQTCFPFLEHGHCLRALSAGVSPMLGGPPTHLLDHDAVHAHGLEPPCVVEHVRPAQGHGQHEAGEVLFVGKQVQEDREYHKHSLDKTVQETQETRALLTSQHQGRYSNSQPPLIPEPSRWWC